MKQLFLILSLLLLLPSTILAKGWDTGRWNITVHFDGGFMIELGLNDIQPKYLQYADGLNLSVIDDTIEDGVFNIKFTSDLMLTVNHKENIITVRKQDGENWESVFVCEDNYREYKKSRGFIKGTKRTVILNSPENSRGTNDIMVIMEKINKNKKKR